MNSTELKKWLRDNSSGIYRPSREAADLIEDQEMQLRNIAKLCKELQDSPISFMSHMSGWADRFLANNPVTDAEHQTPASTRAQSPRSV